jgi:ATP-binding cassette subfamily B (MDR/TAP) protein 1
LVAQSIDDGCEEDNNCVTGGTVLTVFFCILMGSMAIGQLTAPMNAFVSARVAAGKLYATIERKPLIDGLSVEGQIPSSRAQGEITLEGVDFSYSTRPDVKVCSNYNLKISTGQSVISFALIFFGNA